VNKHLKLKHVHPPNDAPCVFGCHANRLPGGGSASDPPPYTSWISVSYMGGGGWATPPQIIRQLEGGSLIHPPPHCLIIWGGVAGLPPPRHLVDIRELDGGRSLAQPPPDGHLGHHPKIAHRTVHHASTEWSLPFFPALPFLYRA